VRVLGRRHGSVMACTANARNGNVVSVDLESKVLERVAVSDGPCGVCLGKLEDTRVFGGRAVVLDNTLADLGDVKEAMEKVRCPVGVCGTVRDVVAKHAQAIQRLTDLVGQVTDDSFRGCILSTPVASPAFLTAVAIDVVASEENIRLVAVDDLGEPPKRLTRRRVAKVLLEDLGRVAPAKNVVACLTADGEGLVETVLNVCVLGSIARCVDGVLMHRAGVPGCRGSGRCGSSYSDGHCILTRN
jgi:tRNA U54 and U55 pseudouridine synthase Pus10